MTDEPGRKEQVPAGAEMLFRGRRGEKGDKGDTGMPATVRRAVIALFLMNLMLDVVLLFGGIHYENSQQAEQRKQFAAQQAAQAKQGQVIEQKLCSTFDALAANKPPPGNPGTNPSRAYDQRNAQILGQVPSDIDCGKKKPR